MLQAVEAVNVEHKSRYVDVTTVLVDVAGRIIKATDAILPQLGPSVLSAPSSPSLSRATSHTSIDQSDPSQPFLPGDSSVIRKNRTELTQFVSQMVTHTKLAVGVWPAPNACIDMLVMLMASAQGILRLLGCVQMCSAWSQYRADLHNLLRLKYSTDARFNGTGTSTSATPTTPTASAAATATPSPVGGTGTERPKISLPTADAPEDPTLANRRKARISSYNGTGAPTLIPTSLALVDMIRKIGHDLCINTVISSTLERLIATINRITTSLSNDLRVDRRDAAIEHAMNLSAATAQVVEEVDAMELNFIDVGVRFRWDSCKTELAVCIDDFKSIRFMITGITAPTPQGIDRYIAVTKSVSVSCQHLLTAAKAVIEHQEQLLVQHHRDQDAHIKSHATARHKMNQLTVAFNKHSDAFANRVTDTQTLPPIAQSPPNSASQPATPTIPRPSPLSGSSTPATGSTGSSSTPSLTGSLGSSQTNSLTNSLPTSQTNSLSNSLAASSLSSSMNDLSMEDGIVFGEEVAGDGKEAPVRPVKGGTLVKLVERLTFQSHPDPQFTTAFLLTYRSFTDPLKLLDLLIERYSTQPPDILVNQGLRDKYMTETIVPIRLRVFNALKLWINTNWDDFKSDDVLQARLKAFLDIMSVDLDTAAQHLRRLLERKWTVGDIGRKFVFDSKLPTPIIHQNIRQSSQILTVLDIDPLELARQLTIIDWKEHAAIQPKECLDLAWTKKDREQAPHILAMIDLATRLSFWVASAILSEDAVKARAKVVAHFIMVAEKCRSLNNFNAVMAVLAGMSNAAVYRLKKTWEALPNKVRSSYSELKELMSEQNNFGRYRQVLHSIDPPCIPFLGIYLTDLVMIESGNKNFIKGTDLINFDKRRKIASVIQEIQQYQQSPYHLQEVEPIAQFIANVPFMESKDEMYEKSLILEPRDGSTPAAAKQPTNTIGRTGMRKNSVAPPTFSKEA
ncbi:hypothetical protein CAOG_009414 [Capsaspora owczarzaki ATCC 30864]|uniref:Uncharacterized protein n=1 Tax=Capsaspora owczarzaki (strain ATCC 30864) TaxID=595528 RepID=A0A0D2VIV3_CAPO3|nr:hypothetical protein CAOG_009414 [Capsaspora owczarzaki ATCC 30864]